MLKIAPFLIGGSAMALAALPAAAQTTIAQKIAIPAYYHYSDAHWTAIANDAPETELVVVNVMNGPGYAHDGNFAPKFTAAHAAGIKVIGYVDSGYLGTSGQKTRSGQESVEAWRAQIQADVNSWYAFYGSTIDGIFFDQGTGTCGTGFGDEHADAYKSLNAYVKRNHPGATTIINPGIAVPSCMENAADTLVTFEGPYNCYVGASSCDASLRYQAPNWGTSDGSNSRKFYHLVYNTGEADLANAQVLSKARNAGYVYITDAGGSGDFNPWDDHPSGTFWSAERAGIAAGGTADTTAPNVPETVDTVAEGFVDATLDWVASTDAGSGVNSYDVYHSGIYLKTISAVPLKAGDMREPYIDDLTAGGNNSVTVKARDRAGNMSPSSVPKVWQSELPSGATVTAPGSLTSSDATYTSTALNWTASTTSSGAIKAYDVYAGSTRILTLPGTVTTTYALGLTPGTSYAFTVKARDDQGNTSGASNTANVSMGSLPGGLGMQPAANGTGGNDFTSTQIIYKGDYFFPYAFRRIFIDTDSNSETGYLYGEWNNKVGAEYMIENNYFMKYSGSGYNWETVGIVPSYAGYTAT